ESARAPGRAGVPGALLARDTARVRAVAEAVRAEAVTAVELTADVTDPGAVRAAVAQAEAGLGAIDLLVNNAGALEPERPLWEADPDEWWSVFETNVRGPFLFERYVLPGMLAQGGRPV